MKYLALVLLVVASPALAFDACDDLWFTRNLVFDRAGYCFGSPLGRAVFDNGDCRTNAPVLSTADQEIIAAVKTAEREFACHVDTDRTGLNLPDVPRRKTMTTLPVIEIFESGCYGWRSSDVALFDGVETGARQIGDVVRGDDILFLHVFQEPYSFVLVYRDDMFVAQGWGIFPVDGQSCEMAAG